MEELEARAHAAGLAGTAALIWDYGRRTYTYGPTQWQAFLSSISTQWVTPRRSGPKAVSSDWQARANNNCNIKGNRNRKGQWIYHVPGMPYYDQTRPEEIFCTEAEAQAAGYRRAIVK